MAKAQDFVALGTHRVRPLAYGCMSLSHAYAIPPSDEVGARVLLKALDLGHDFFDTAAIYGLGHNERLVGRTLGRYRDRFVLASKCGWGEAVDGKRAPDGRPERIREVCEESLRNLETDFIDLYYLHRLDKNVPIEDSVGTLADLVREGKIGAIGLSEVSAETLRRAHALHPIAALQSEYSLWTRNAELGALQACRELGVAYVAFSPLGRGVLTDAPPDPAAFDDKDIRRVMPRFQDPAWPRNRALVEPLRALAARAGCPASHLALRWVMAQAPHIIALPGTANEAHLIENWASLETEIDDATLAELDRLINRSTVAGPRYTPGMQAFIDTEEFAD